MRTKQSLPNEKQSSGAQRTRNLNIVNLPVRIV